MAYLFLALIGVVGIMWFRAWLHRAPPETRNRIFVQTLLTLVGVALLLLVITGRLPWLFALIGGILPWVNRLMTMRSLWDMWQRHGGARPCDRDMTMSAEQAREILGLAPGASRAEVIAAHRQLMQKIHPDRGGSSYLAAQLNQAKKVLLAADDDA